MYDWIHLIYNHWIDSSTVPRVVKTKAAKQLTKINKKIRRNNLKKHKRHEVTVVKNAIASIKRRNSFRGVSTEYGIPLSTLHRKYSLPEDKLCGNKRGREPHLSLEVENNIVNWILFRAESGMPVSKMQVQESVQIK
ncbi:hypothetical protein TKK_0008026 [Trichogramma kaykai]